MVGLRSNRRLERAGVNAVRSLFEAAGHIVQEIDGGNDHGEDLYVRFVEAGKLSSYVVAIQVKSGAKYRRSMGYSIPVGSHGKVWRTSNIPVIGIVFDPEFKMLYWVNITEYLKSNPAARSITIGEGDTLTSDSIARVCSSILQSAADRTLDSLPTVRSIRDLVLASFRKSENSQPSVIGGKPNAYFDALADWTEVRSMQLQQLAIGVSRIIILASAVLTTSFVYDFGKSYAPYDARVWTFVVCGFAFWALYCAYREKRAGRRAVLLQTVSTIPLVVYCYLSRVEIPKPVGALISGLGVGVASKGIIILSLVYTLREIARRRRLQAAYGPPTAPDE